MQWTGRGSVGKRRPRYRREQWRRHGRRARMAADRHVLKTSGTVVVAAACGKEYGFTDVDGKQPKPLTVDGV